MQQRQIVLDTETTGLDPAEGHRIIEIGCVEIVNRRLTGRHFHQYLQPDRAIDDEAIRVHGITNEFLTDKPRFEEVAEAFLTFVDNSELIIHNAAFDTGFIDHELKRLGTDRGTIGERCRILDSLAMARRLHPGQKNNLDALCKRYAINNSQRTLHGALLDAEILADVYLAMTGGQETLSLTSDTGPAHQTRSATRRQSAADRPALAVLNASTTEQQAHRDYLSVLDKKAGGSCLWSMLDEPVQT